MRTANEIGSEALSLAKKIEIFESRNRTDAGEWKTKKAEKEAAAMQRKLDTLDAELDEVCPDGR